MGIVSVIQLNTIWGGMIAYVELGSDTIGWPQGMLYRFEYSLVQLYTCV